MAKRAKSTGPKLEDLVKLAVRAVYEDRRDRVEHPEGKQDSASRWYPSRREDADGDGSQARTPSRAWPWSYMLRCRTRQHCSVLVDRAMDGRNVPDDARDMVAVILLWRAGFESVTPAALRIARARVYHETRLRWLADLLAGGETAESAIAGMSEEGFAAMINACDEDAQDAA